MKKLTVSAAVLALFVPAGLASAQSHNLKESPNVVSAGSPPPAHFSGSVGSLCSKGARVTIYSTAFAGVAKHKYNGIPAVWTTVGSNQKFSKNVQISFGLKVGGDGYKSYTAGARCGGSTVGTTTFTVYKQGY